MRMGGVRRKARRSLETTENTFRSNTPKSRSMNPLMRVGGTGVRVKRHRKRSNRE